MKECKKHWNKNNKSKDINIFEGIKNDLSLDNDKKNKKVNDCNKALENFSSIDPKYKKIIDIPSLDKISPDKIFHGKHYLYYILL